MKDLCSCDVEDKELLAHFREKLTHWKTCLSGHKDRHSICSQLTTLFWDHAIYRTFNEARRLSEDTNDPSTGLQGTIIDLLDRSIGKKVELFVDEFLLCSVPTPQFDQLQNWDKPVIVTKDLDSLREYWYVRVMEIKNWDREATVIDR